MRLAVLAILLTLSACTTQVPRSYTWDAVDCRYQRGTEGLERDQVKADCELEGRVEFHKGLPF